MDIKPTLLKNAFVTLLGVFAVVAALTLLPGRAGAATFAGGPLQYQDPMWTTAGIWYSHYTPAVPAGAFSDTITFSVGSPFTFSLSDPYNFVPNSTITYNDITGLTANLWNVTGVPYDTTYSGSNLLNTTPVNLTAGNYELRVNGVAGTSGYAGYSGAMSFTNLPGFGPPLAPIPEPETYAMMVAGLGLMGFIARRRRHAG